MNCPIAALIRGEVLQNLHVGSNFTELMWDFVPNDRFAQGTFGQFTAGLIGYMSRALRQVHGGGKVGAHRASLQAVIQWPLISNINFAINVCSRACGVLGPLASARCCILKRRAERAFSIGSCALPQVLTNRVCDTGNCLIRQLRCVKATDCGYLNLTSVVRSLH